VKVLNIALKSSTHCFSCALLEEPRGYFDVDGKE
jgi:hypothetical protein